MHWHAGRRSSSGAAHRIKARRVGHWNVLVVEAGELLVRLGRAPTRRLAVGEGVLIRPGMEHDVGMRTTGRVCWADFDLHVWDIVPLAHFVDLPTWLAPSPARAIAKHIVDLNHINSRAFGHGMTDVCEFFACQSRFIELLLQQAHFTSDATLRLAALQRIQSILEAIRSAPGRTWTRDDLCQLGNIGPTQLTKLFSQATGTTPMRFIALQALDRAAKLLLTTDRSCADIAELCGFCDAYHLSKRFKSHYGMSPSAYRQQSKA